MKAIKREKLIKTLKLCSIIIFTLVIATKSLQYYFKTQLLEFEKERLHIRDEYRYKIVQNVGTDVFGSYTVIQFELEDDIKSLEKTFVKDSNMKSCSTFLQIPYFKMSEMSILYHFL